jgi:hypothetical protein
MKLIQIAAVISVLVVGVVHGGEADVVSVAVKALGDSAYRFEVTVQHADEGWKHYADKWEVLAPDGTVLATRILHHPHVNEQPFSRSLYGVKIPGEINKVTIQVHDSVHQYGGKVATVDLETLKMVLEN